MSYDLSVFVRRDWLPSSDLLRDALRKRGVEVVADDIADLSAAHGFLPVVIKGAPSGFELDGEAITDADRDEYRRLLARDGAASDDLMEILAVCDLELAFSCHASDDELAAMRIMATTVASLAHGWLDDPYAGKTTSYL